MPFSHSRRETDAKEKEQHSPEAQFRKADHREDEED